MFSRHDKQKVSCALCASIGYSAFNVHFSQRSQRMRKGRKGPPRLLRIHPSFPLRGRRGNLSSLHLLIPSSHLCAPSVFLVLRSTSFQLCKKNMTHKIKFKLLRPLKSKNRNQEINVVQSDYSVIFVKPLCYES